MDDQITIIEGPPPVFERIDESWAQSLNESPDLYDMALTRLRTFNGRALVERCHRAWSKQKTIFLHYKNTLGLEQKVPILAARTTEADDGQVLYLWIRREVDAEDDEFEDDNPLN
jgi:hypothetical protein